MALATQQLKRFRSARKGWGPAFFTKFLMFVDPANSGGDVFDLLPAAVLDRLTASQANGFLPNEMKFASASQVGIAWKVWSVRMEDHR